MSTLQLCIELSALDGSTHVADFHALPTWADLATRVQTLFGIPGTAAALAYVDADGDEITMSSENELREFFTTAFPGDNATPTALLFAVRGLRELRVSESSSYTMSTPPAGPQSRNSTVFPTQGIFAPYGRGTSTGGGRGYRGGFRGHLHGPHFGHGHHCGPPGMFPAHQSPPLPVPPYLGGPFVRIG
ncbi:hypothetical protein FOMPIDRAFT_1118302 [Fomitopsis schrenkii]|uniref:PB1 domain-containing protein n=1 Tax=Fomitopsis schrenkii TaxID=2126942 RepID=S8ECS1_FOMSC|nr:hypothetical protein FOMPIDRAFT_1118302 [Fomitopsis schrenkii]